MFSTVFKTLQKNTGLTLIESLVAVSVILAAITGPITIAAQGLSIANFSKQQFTAILLAQEAIEFVRATRDDAALAGDSWDTWLVGDISVCVGSKNCTVDVRAGTPFATWGGETLYKHTDTGLYGHETTSGWEDTGFTRRVTITEISSGSNVDEVEIRVIVSWQTGLNSKTITVRDHLFAWQ